MLRSAGKIFILYIYNPLIHEVIRAYRELSTGLQNWMQNTENTYLWTFIYVFLNTYVSIECPDHVCALYACAYQKCNENISFEVKEKHTEYSEHSQLLGA